MGEEHVISLGSSLPQVDITNEWVIWEGSHTRSEKGTKSQAIIPFSCSEPSGCQKCTVAMISEVGGKSDA